MLGLRAEAFSVLVCFTMVLLDCVPLQCVRGGPDPDQDHGEVRFNLQLAKTRKKETVANI